MTAKRISEFVGKLLVIFATILVLLFILILIVDIFSKGAKVLSFDFIFSNPTHGMTKGGIWPAIVGSLYLSLLTAILSIPIGIGAAIYLNEYAQKNLFTQIIRASIRNLAGVPSVVFGLFGVTLFANAMQMGTSLLASACTLGLLTLPYIIASTEEALRNVPNSYREAALALGASKWEAIYDHVLPSAKNGIITGVILGLSRAIGETAPILFTGVSFYQRFLPHSPLDEFMALPYHIFILSTQHFAIDLAKPLAYGSTLILLLIILVLNVFALILKHKKSAK